MRGYTIQDARRISGRKRAEQPRGGATQLSEGCAHWMGTENGAPVHIQTRHWQKNIRHGKLSPRTRRSDYVARRLSMLGWVLRSIQAVTSGCTAAITLARPLLMSVQYDLGARQEHPIPGSSCRRTSSSQWPASTAETSAARWSERYPWCASIPSLIEPIRRIAGSPESQPVLPWRI
ncbi:hypothetical protein BD311DRAFT_324966 [Dichomitus squalens]|uniref:Uncharacterized protein n=1 Tax=Dichomitus squalens TaxID=114155 RepID=A0A4Q9MN34_9APHY|nr:hypothetical protein BD311DRAFT_324966 [Dichomitus squalens]